MDNIILIDKDNNDLIMDDFRINIKECFNNIKGFYKKDNKVYMILNIEEDFEDEVFYNIIEKVPYDEFNYELYPKDDEYYVTFIFEFPYLDRESLEKIINDELSLFREKVLKIYCNNM